VTLENTILRLPWQFPAQKTGPHSICDDPSMPLSTVTALVRNLIAMPAAILHSRVAKDAEVHALRHENAVLRLAALSRLVPRERWRQAFAVTPTTLLARHRRLIARKWTFTRHRRPGRPSTAPAVKQLILRLARENNNWGHHRIQGDLARLDYPIAPSTAWSSSTPPASTPPRSAPAQPGGSS
jgi:hypothetical protein